MLKLCGKKKIVSHNADVLKSAQGIVLMGSSGMDANQSNKLRCGAREQKVIVSFVKNTLMRRAVRGTQFEPLSDKFVGPLVLLIATEEPADAAKVAVEFIKSAPGFAATAISLGGDHIFQAEDLVKISKMPTKQDLLGQLAAQIQSPIMGLVGLMSSVPMHLVSTFEALLVKKTNDSKGG